MKTNLEVSKAVIKKNDMYLILKRADNAKSYPCLWDFPGGKDEKGETHAKSVIREVFEETSLLINPGKEIKNKSYKDNEYIVNLYYFSPEKVEGEIKLSNEHSEYNWLKEEEIKKLELHPSIKLFFKQ